VDEDLTWYRYHRLFKEYLHKTLLVEIPGRDQDLHLRASTWFQQQGLLEEAIDYALAAGSTAQVVQMIAAVAFEKLMRSEISSLMRWIEALPEKVVQEHVELCLIHAWTLMLRGGPIEQVEARLEIIEQATENDHYLGSAAAMRALMASINGQPQESLQYSQQAMKLVPENDLFTRSLIFDNLGMVHLMFGDFEAAIDDFSLAVDLSQKGGNQMITVGGLCNMAGIWMLQGQLKRAWDANLQALERATDKTGRRLPIAAKALLGLGEISREWNDLQGAVAYYEEGLELFQSYGELGSILSYVSLARIHEIQGDYPAAQEVVNLARKLARDFTASQMDDELVESYQVQLWLVMGEKKRAGRWVEEINLKELVNRNPPAGYFDPVWEVRCQTLARFYMSRDDFQAAREIIERVLAAAESAQRMRSVIRYLAVLSVLLYQQEEKEGALETISQALDLALEESYVRTFLDEGLPMERLLYMAAEHDVHPAYVGRLLKEFRSESSIKKPEEDLTNLVEPLSRREIDVLELLSSGKSNQEIAGILHISLSTVKGHTSNIYGKLNVRNRTQAVSRGRELGIIAEK
jgi:LuxR family maltose regulon positive regulatory protein